MVQRHVPALLSRSSTTDSSFRNTPSFLHLPCLPFLHFLPQTLSARLHIRILTQYWYPLASPFSLSLSRPLSFFATLLFGRECLILHVHPSFRRLCDLGKERRQRRDIKITACNISQLCPIQVHPTTYIEIHHISVPIWFYVLTARENLLWIFWIIVTAGYFYRLCNLFKFWHLDFWMSQLLCLHTKIGSFIASDLEMLVL